MLFNTFSFIFVFLPVCLAGYFLLARFSKHPSAHLAWLTLASLVFYGYWDYRFLPIIIISIIGNYVLGRLIAAIPANMVERSWALALAIVVNLSALGFYKYANFAIDTLASLTQAKLDHLAVVLPLGISFFTFTQIAYLVDVYKGHETERSLVRYTLFVTYFPHLIAGPILHHGEMMPQFRSERSRVALSSQFAIGLTVFAIGLFKKVIIADGFSNIANPVFHAATLGNVGTADAWGGALAYALQIYFDFSGYCDMAIGLSRLFGISLPFNFDAPYKSRSIVEFWRRWHITLSRFLRDYLYIALGGNRRGALLRNVNLLATMVIGGLWHGAGWTFIIWGGLHGIFLLINHSWTELRKKLSFGKAMEASAGYAVASLLLTQACVVVAWVFFRADTLTAARRVVSAMFRFGHVSLPANYAHMVGSLTFWMIGLFYLVCVSLPNVNAMFAGRPTGLETYRLDRPWSIVNLSWRPSLPWAIFTVVTFLIALFGILIVGDSTQFLYFQF